MEGQTHRHSRVFRQCKKHTSQQKYHCYSFFISFISYVDTERISLIKVTKMLFSTMKRLHHYGVNEWRNEWRSGARYLTPLSSNSMNQ